MPDLIVIAGPNGSGKTTLSTYLINKGKIKGALINPDEIAKQELGSYLFQIKASKLALQRRKEAINKECTFAFETTFSGNTEIRDIQDAKAKGYNVILYYVALNSVIDNLIRVEERRLRLGHDVVKDDIIRRFDKSQANLLKYISLFDKAYLFDNSGNQRSRVGIFNNGTLLWLNNKHQSHPFYKELFHSPTNSTSATGLNK
ncbi:zeta toxin family protein [Mucilaginibacter limnophilus]|uniref:Zeta toxin family protein n=1 Tax=Mucilaginibacter limnophilus TaxID=1932778 RepID=A0A3S2WX34_9SPHI|nr:zeta toxin family protein [Mucilaginibacter limnophilus]RVU00002.1 zeta toxin family protein [Mucilaginibacter limnophilus]